MLSRLKHVYFISSHFHNELVLLIIQKSCPFNYNEDHFLAIMIRLIYQHNTWKM